MGLHLTDVPARNLVNWKELRDLSTDEKDYLENGRQWYNSEGAYGMLQGTKPQTLAYAVNDSPVGLAAWIIEKFYAWTDHKGDLESVYTMDELLTNLTIYWVTQTAGSAFRIYYESMQHPPKMASAKIGTPAGFCIGPKDLVPPPRELAERIFNVCSWTVLPAGGHFIAMEKPQELAEDIFGFAGMLTHEPVNSQVHPH
jgi:pimeloyl-ACP methyl ester carboxylesterase